jgi:CRISPR-associated endonuclease/helicase Cas3
MTFPDDEEQWLARPETREHSAEALSDHLLAVAQLAHTYGSRFGYPRAGYTLGLLHDVGKALLHFREYLLGNRDRDGYNHSTAGAVLANSTLAVSVASHHTGLRAAEDIANQLAQEVETERVQTALENGQTLVGDRYRGHEDLPEDPLQQAFDLRLLHSALIDADWTRVSQHEGTFAGTEAPSVEALGATMTAAQEEITDHSRQINRRRAEIREQCIEAADGPTGIYTASIPTGGGKTRALMEMALQHAEVHDLDRVIALAPYVSILQQTAQVYRDLFGDHPVLEHHSRVDLQRASTREYAQATSRWDRTIVVSTFVQALESLMHTANSRLRKVHRFSNSVVVFDEIQNLPYDLRETTIWLMEQLERVGATVIASSATQIPMPGTEVIEDPPALYSQMKRIEYVYDLAAYSPTALWEKAAPCSMIVTNRTADARRLAKVNQNAFHLSTRMTPVHQEAVIAEIKERLAAETGRRENVQLVTTPLVEAGVNIDFDQGIRLLGPMDNVIQAAGRVNRERRLEAGRMLITKLKGGGLPPGAYKVSTQVHEEMVDLHGDMDLNDPQWLKKYYERMEARVESAHPRIANALSTLDYPTAHAEYQLIDNAEQVDCLVANTEYGAPPAFVEQIRSESITTRLLREAQKYTVSLYQSSEDLIADGRAEVLRDELDLYLWTGLYDDRLGIT